MGGSFLTTFLPPKKGKKKPPPTVGVIDLGGLKQLKKPRLLVGIVFFFVLLGIFVGSPKVF